MRYFVIFVMVCILGSLFSALFFMFRDKGDSRRMVKALTIRVALSVSLFLMLMVLFYFGVIGRSGLLKDTGARGTQGAPAESAESARARVYSQ